MTDSREIWITTGYEHFSLFGLGELKVEKLAKKVGISKSSFYHHFADMDVFIEHLLQLHLKQSKIIAQKELVAQAIDPELIQVLLDHKIDLLFNRQLRVHRSTKAFAETLQQSNLIIGNSFVWLWVRELNLRLNEQQLSGIFELALENFYLQITPETLTYPWLSEYFANLKSITQRLG